MISHKKAQNSQKPEDWFNPEAVRRSLFDHFQLFCGYCSPGPERRAIRHRRTIRGPLEVPARGGLALLDPLVELVIGGQNKAQN